MVYLCIASSSQALHRVMERDGTTKEAAQRRIDAQLSNGVRVDKANVLLSTLWQAEETQKQVCLLQHNKVCYCYYHRWRRCGH